jgi:hypothetical protein
MNVPRCETGYKSSYIRRQKWVYFKARRRISKQVTTYSTSAVLSDVIVLLHVSIGSSTVQHVHVRWLVLVVKMATVFEGCTTDEQRSLVHFCRQMGPLQRIFIKKFFLFMVGSVCRVKWFTIGSRNSLKDEEIEK